MKVKKSNKKWEDLPEVITPMDYAEVMGIGEQKAREFFKSKGFPRVPGTGIKQLGYRDLVKRFSEGKPLEEKIDNSNTEVVALLTDIKELLINFQQNLK